MVNNLYKKDLDLACNATAPSGPIYIDMDDEIRDLQEYLGRKYNDLSVPQELEARIKEIGFSHEKGFDKWFIDRQDYYKNRWEEELQKGDIEVKNKYNFLSETFKTLDKCSWWVQNAYQLLVNLDRSTSQFESQNENKKILSKKVDNFCKEKIDWRNLKQQEIERQVLAFLAELKTAKELEEKGYQEIQFIEEQTIKTPDISAKKDGQIFYIEVKRIQNPREEDEAFRSTGNHSGDVSVDFREALKKKIRDFICDAKEKFECINGDVKLSTEQKILVLDFTPGLDAKLNRNNFNPALEEIFGTNFFFNLEHAHDIQIWPRKYFK